MTVPVSLYRANISEIAVGGTPVVAMYGPMMGGVIVNPSTADGQGLATVEEIYVDITGPASLGSSPTTVTVQPGGYFTVPLDQTTNVSVNAASSGHKFSAIVWQPKTPFPPTPFPGPFPPSGPTSVLEIIPSYLYEQYSDDEDLQAFVSAYNSMAQSYLDWFNSAQLPIYTLQSGELLDWSVYGLYGLQRPSLSSGSNKNIGPLNTYRFNVLRYNQLRRVGPQNIVVTSDDIFKRIVTWNFFKGDGNKFNIRWLKRRVIRFLSGVDGAGIDPDQTYIVSVSVGGGVVSIKLAVGTRTFTGGAMPNRFRFNTKRFNAVESIFHSSTDAPPLASVFKEAADTGALQLPFQYTFIVTV